MTRNTRLVLVQEVDGPERLGIVLSEVREGFRRADYSPELTDFTGELRQQHDQYFYQSRGPSGVDWPDWYWRKKESSNDHITLFDSGRLRASLTATGKAADHVENLTPRSLEWGTSVPYSATHNFGATLTTTIGLYGRNGGYLPAGTQIRIPQREHVGTTPDRIENLTNATADATVDSLKLTL